MKHLWSLVPLPASLTFAVQGATTAQAQTYPTRPVTLISPWPAGGASDAICRVLGARLADQLGKPVVIEKHRRVARNSAADGQDGHDPRQQSSARGPAALHQLRDRPLGQGRASGWHCRFRVEKDGRDEPQ